MTRPSSRGGVTSHVRRGRGTGGVMAHAIQGNVGSQSVLCYSLNVAQSGPAGEARTVGFENAFRQQPFSRSRKKTPGRRGAFINSPWSGREHVWPGRS